MDSHLYLYLMDYYHQLKSHPEFYEGYVPMAYDDYWRRCPCTNEVLFSPYLFVIDSMGLRLVKLVFNTLQSLLN